MRSFKLLPARAEGKPPRPRTGKHPVLREARARLLPAVGMTSFQHDAAQAVASKLARAI
ncbi:hypothetical protein ABBQ38_013853 [Trebouxia sp. C0009 RCD-2024]